MHAWAQPAAFVVTNDVPSGKRGTDYLQEDTPDLLFRDVAVYTQTIASAEQAPAVFHQAIAESYGERGVAHLNIPPDVFSAKVSSASLAPAVMANFEPPCRIKVAALVPTPMVPLPLGAA